MIYASLLALAIGTAASGGQSTAPVRTVPSVDIDRYLGEWHEAARLPNRFQRDCAGDVRATYSRRGDGRIDVTNRCRQQDGSIKEYHPQFKHEKKMKLVFRHPETADTAPLALIARYEALLKEIAERVTSE